MRKFFSAFVLAIVLALPASAQAEDFCAGAHPLCPSGATVLTADTTGFFNSLVGAQTNAGSDRIYLAAGTYTIASGISVGFIDAVEIHGEGVGSTIFSSSATAQDILNFQFVGASVFEGFTMNVTGSPSQTNGLVISGGEVKNFEVNDLTGGTANNFTAVDLSDSATARDFTVNMSDDGQAVKTYDNSATIDQARLNGTGNVNAQAFDVSNVPSTPITITRTTIDNFSTGINIDSGSVDVSDTAIALGVTANAVGVEAYNQNAGSTPIEIDVDRVTIYGNVGQQKAIRVGADFPTEVVTATIDDSLLHMPFNPSQAIVCLQDNSGTVNLTVENSAYDPDKLVETIQNCNITFPTNQINTFDEVPTFVDADNGDLRHAANSPMIDRLDGSALAQNAVDRDGDPRVVDGNGDCVVKLDVGAYEFQPTSQPSCLPTPPTTPPATPAPPATAKLTTRAKKAFVRSRSGFRKRTNPRATAFGVTYKNAHIARFELEQSARGVRKGGKCVAKGKGRGCNYFKKLRGIQRQAVTDGEIFYTFGGRFNGKRLKPGRYRVKITPFAEGAVEGTPIYVPFKLR